MSYAPSLRAVRAHFDLPQRELGVWLGLSRQQLTRIEAGTDPLPAHAVAWLWPWLTALTVQLTAPEPAAEPLPSVAGPPPGMGPAPLLARWRECHYQAEALGRLLAAEQLRTRTWRRRLAAGPELLATLPPEPAPPATEEPAVARRRRWLARLLEAAADSLHPAHLTTGPTAEALLAARHSGFVQEAAWLAGHLAAG